MGACASFPKTLGGAAGKAPVPEQPKEETIESVALPDKAERKEEVKTAVEGEEEKSLGSLLESNEEVKKETSDVAAPAVEELVAAPAPALPAEEPKKE